MNRILPSDLDTRPEQLDCIRLISHRQVTNQPELRRRDPNDVFIRNLFRNAHQIENMIWQANWKESNFNITDYFTRVVTGIY